MVATAVRIDATGSCRDALSDSVRTASVHLNYAPPVAQAAFLVATLEPRDVASATYFASKRLPVRLRAASSNPTIQSNRAIFSIWIRATRSTTRAMPMISLHCSLRHWRHLHRVWGRRNRSQISARRGTRAGPHYYVTQAHEVGDRAQFSGACLVSIARLALPVAD